MDKYCFFCHIELDKDNRQSHNCCVDCWRDLECENLELEREQYEDTEED